MMVDRGGRRRPPMRVGIVELTMVDPSLSALTKAWVTTLVASALLFIALAAAQVRDNRVFLRTLSQVLLLIGDNPPPVIDRWN